MITTTAILKTTLLMSLSLASVLSMSQLHAENDFATALAEGCQHIKREAHLGKQAYDQQKYQTALTHFEYQARWSSFCQVNAEESPIQISNRDIEVAYNNVGLAHQKLGQNHWARAWFSIRPDSKLSQHNLKQLPALSKNNLIAGKYVQYAGYGEWNIVEVEAHKNEYKISFSGLYMGLRSLIYGPNIGEFDTNMAKNQQQASYQYEQCDLNLNFATAQHVQITQQGASEYCGFGYNVSATGDYLKVE